MNTSKNLETPNDTSKKAAAMNFFLVAAKFTNFGLAAVR